VVSFVLVSLFYLISWVNNHDSGRIALSFSTKTIRPISGLYPQFDAEHVIIEGKKAPWLYGN
jgi:hypothetical protein